MNESNDNNSFNDLLKQKIITAVRIRPLNTNETNNNCKIVTTNDINDETSITLTDPIYFQNNDTKKVNRNTYDRQFNYDYTFWSLTNSIPFASQEVVYDKCGKPLVNHCINGFNCCLLAFGQTGSGKTYTMLGNNINNREEWGVIPRLCYDIYHCIELKQGNNSDKETVINAVLSVSFYEIYNEKVYDLLCNDPNTSSCRVREHPKDGVYVENLTINKINEYNDITKVLLDGQKKRSMASTLMNATSSRSHALFTIYLQQELYENNNSNETIQRNSKIILVDLAGSERVSLTGVSGERLIEANNINKSLSTLGDVIKALSDKSISDKSTIPIIQSANHPATPKRDNFIPYRNSILTWLLKESLSGNSKSTILATVSPSELSYNETFNTLKYIEKCKYITTFINKNEKSNNTNNIIINLKKEILQLKSNNSLLYNEKVYLSKLLENYEKGSSIIPTGLISNISTQSMSSLSIDMTDQSIKSIKSKSIKSPKALDKQASNKKSFDLYINTSLSNSSENITDNKIINPRESKILNINTDSKNISNAVPSPKSSMDDYTENDNDYQLKVKFLENEVLLLKDELEYNKILLKSSYELNNKQFNSDHPIHEPIEGTNQMTDLLTQLDIKNKYISKLEYDLDQINQSYYNIKLQLDSSMSMFDKANNELVNILQKYQDLLVTNGSVQNKLDNELSTSKQLNDRLENMTNNYNDVLSKFNSELSYSKQLSNTVNQLQIKLDDEVDKNKQNTKSYYDTAEQLKESQEKLMNQTEKYNQLSAEYTILKNENSKLNKDFIKLNNVNDSYKNMIEQYDNLTIKHNQLFENNKLLQSKLDNEIDKSKDIRNELNTLSLTHNNLLNDNLTTNKKFNDEVVKNKLLTDNLNNLQIKYNDLLNNNKTLNIRYDNLLKEINELRVECNHLYSDIDKAKQLDNLVNELKSDLQIETENCVKMSNDYKSLLVEYKKLQENLNYETVRNDTSNQSYNDVKNQLDSLTVTNSSLLDKYSALQSSYYNEIDSKQELINRFNDLNTNFINIVEENKSLNIKLEDRIIIYKNLLNNQTILENKLNDQIDKNKQLSNTNALLLENNESVNNNLELEVGKYNSLSISFNDIKDQLDHSERKFTELSKFYNDLEIKISTEIENSQNLSKQLENYEIMCNMYTNDISNLNNKLNEETNINDQLKVKIVELQVNLDNIYSRYNELDLKYDVISQQNNQIQNKLEDEIIKSNSLSNQLNIEIEKFKGKVINFNQLSNENINLKDQLDYQINKAISLTNTLEIVNKKLTDEIDKHMETFQTYVNITNNNVSLQDNYIQALSNIETLKGNYKDVCDRNILLAQEIENYGVNISNYNQVIDEYKLEVVSYKSQLDNYTNEIAIANDKINKYLQIIDDYEKQLLISNNQIENYLEEIDNYKVQIDDYVQQTNLANVLLTSFSNEISKLKETIEEHEINNANYLSEINSNKEHIDNCNNQLVDYIKQIDILNQLLKDKQSDIQNFETRVLDLTYIISNNKDTIDSLSKENDDIKQNLNSYISKYTELLNVNDDLEKKIASITEYIHLSDENLILKKKLDVEISKCIDVSHMNRSLTKENETLQSNIQNEIKKFTSLKNNFSDLLVEHQNVNQSLNNEIDKYNDLMTKYNQLSEDYFVLSNDVNNERNMAKELSSKNELLLSNYNIEVERYNQLNDKYNQLTETHNETFINYKELIDEVNSDIYIRNEQWLVIQHVLNIVDINMTKINTDILDIFNYINDVIDNKIDSQQKLNVNWESIHPIELIQKDNNSSIYISTINESTTCIANSSSAAYLNSLRNDSSISPIIRKFSIETIPDEIKQSEYYFDEINSPKQTRLKNKSIEYINKILQHQYSFHLFLFDFADTVARLSTIALTKLHSNTISNVEKELMIKNNVILEINSSYDHDNESLREALIDSKIKLAVLTGEFDEIINTNRRLEKTIIELKVQLATTQEQLDNYYNYN